VEGEVWEIQRGELKKIKILFTGKVGPYREIFPSILTSLGLQPRAVFTVVPIEAFRKMLTSSFPNFEEFL
jgi:hypothetical protein